jgi:hypothetical protein
MMGAPTQLGQLERANLGHWMMGKVQKRKKSQVKNGIDMVT